MLTLTIRPQGYMANQMIQYMFARTIQSLSERPSKIIHYNAELFGHPATSWKDELPDWGINFPNGNFSNEKCLWVKGNDINFGRLLKNIESKKYDNLVICGPLVNLRYYYNKNHYNNLFIPSEKDVKLQYICSENEILIHIRGGDIMQGAHRDYFPLPTSYYKGIIQKSGLHPVFMGQIGDDIYSRSLKNEFAGAKFLERKTVVADFETLRNAKNVITSISSFAWLATWLSTRSQTIYYPVAGILNPRQRNDIDLVPRDDDRYLYTRFDRWKFNAKKDDFDYILSNGIKYKEISKEQIPFFKNRIHRGIHNKFKLLIPLSYKRTRDRPLSLKSPDWNK